MTKLPTSAYIHIHGVNDPGSPNFERVVLRVTGPLDLAGFGLTVAFVGEGGDLLPFFDYCFWFPNLALTEPTWILIHSRRGALEWSSHGDEKVLNLFWQRDRTIFSRETPKVVPLLFKVDSVAAGELL